MEGGRRRRPEDDEVVVVRGETGEPGKRPPDSDRDDRSERSVRALDESRSGSDGEQRREIEEVTVLDEGIWREAKVEGRDLDRQQRDKHEEQPRERMSLLALRPRHRG